MKLRRKGITRMIAIGSILAITGSLGYLAHAVNDSSEEVKSVEKSEKPAEADIQIPDVVATVNGVDIIRKQLEDRVNQSRAMDPKRFDAMDTAQRKRAMARTIDSMVNREVVYQEALKRNISVTEEEVDESLEGLKRQFPSKEEFEKAFSDAKMTLPAWREETRKNLLAAKLEVMMRDELQISDNDIKDYYEKNKSSLNMDLIKISHILLNTEEDAQKVLKELNETKDFEGLANKYSIDQFTKDKGGDLGWYGRGELLKEVEEAAYALSPGKVSDPVKSQYGYHIIRLDEKKLASEQTLEDHREHVRAILQQTKWQKVRSAWLNGLLTNATVQKWTP